MGLAAWSSVLALLAQLGWLNADCASGLTPCWLLFGGLWAGSTILPGTGLVDCHSHESTLCFRGEILALIRRFVGAAGRGIVRTLYLRPLALLAATVAVAALVGTLVPPTSPGAGHLAEVHALAMSGSTSRCREAS